MIQNIGFISTRFAGTDGVTLESGKWAEVLEASGHKCFWLAGELDKDSDKGILIEKAHFRHAQNVWINEQVFGRKRRNAAVTDLIHELRASLKSRLYEFIERFELDLLIAENVLTIPMQIPLGLALTEVLAETQLPTIAHHHDFFWERVRFSINAVSDYLSMAFPPNLANIEHVVINSAAREELAHRRGISSIIIPNVLDFHNPPTINHQRAQAFRRSIDLDPDDRIILQPTRIVKRKGIEYAIDLVRELRPLSCKLVISHEAGDEGFEYPDWIQEYARDRQVDLRLVQTRIADPWAGRRNTEEEYSLWDIYPFADFITYPSRVEGFGNAFLEAVYFKKPILINRYATFVRDIEPQGFDLVVMDGFLTKKTIAKVRKILESVTRREKMVNTNYEIATRHYSYAVLQKQLNSMMIKFFGTQVPQHLKKVVRYLTQRIKEDG
jgi:glycosyltransferase involved in cell wall biosynthesis